MVRRIHRGWLIVIGVATLSCPTGANGQIFSRAPAGVPLPEGPPVEGNVSCGLISCPPNAGTFGVFHEHWRRWPEEPVTTLPAELLSPFARPRRGLPPVQPPDKTHEESLAPPRRGIDGASEPPAAPAAPPRQPETAPAAPTRQPQSATPSAPALPQPSDRDLPAPPPAMDDDLPSPLDVPATPPSSGGFFPSTDDDSGQLPDLPDTDLDGTLPPAADPPEEDADDIFNLDDFGRVDPHRLQRYRLSSARQLRRSDGDPRTARGSSARSPQTRSPVQLAGYRRPVGRANPLRASAPTSYIAPPVEEPEWQAEPAGFEQASTDTTPLTWSEPAAPARRSNPLR